MYLHKNMVHQDIYLGSTFRKKMEQGNKYRTVTLLIGENEIDELEDLICYRGSEADLVPTHGYICQAYRGYWCKLCYKLCFLERGREAPKWCRLDWDFGEWLLKNNLANSVHDVSRRIGLFNKFIEEEH